MSNHTSFSSDSSLMSRSGEMSSSTVSKLCQVIFHDLEEVYATDCDIKARYSIIPGLVAKAGDRVGLYKVGWKSANEFVTFIFAPLPTKLEGRVGITIPVESFSKAEGEMYQLCYITCDGKVVGASIPFSFRVPSADELVAVEDPLDPGLVVYKSRTSQMQDELVSHRVQCEKYVDTIEDMQSKLSKLNLELIGKDDLLEKKCNQVTTLEDIVKIKDSEINELQQDKSLLEVAIGVLKDKQQNNDSVAIEYQEILNRKEKEAEVYEVTIKTLRQDLAAALSTVDRLKDDLQIAKVENESLEHHKNNLTCKVKELSTRHNSSVLEKIEIETQLKELESAMVVKERKLEEALNNVEKLKGEIGELRMTFVSSMSGENDPLHRALVKSEDEKAMFLVTIVSLEEALQTAKKRNEELIAEVAQLKQDKSVALRALKNAEESEKETEKVLSTYLEQVDESQKDQSSETIASLKSRVAVLEIELASNNDKSVDAKLLRESEREIESLRSQVENVSKNCERLMKMTSAQYAQIFALTEEKEKLTSQITEASTRSGYHEFLHAGDADMTTVMSLQKHLDLAMREKRKLEQLVLQLRKDLIGKVSISEVPPTHPYSG